MQNSLRNQRDLTLLYITFKTGFKQNKQKQIKLILGRQQYCTMEKWKNLSWMD